MTWSICHCEKCGASSADVTVDVYNDFDDEPGNLICDPCIDKECREASGDYQVVMLARPEGYYHSPIGAFD